MEVFQRIINLSIPLQDAYEAAKTPNLQYNLLDIWSLSFTELDAVITVDPDLRVHFEELRASSKKNTPTCKHGTSFSNLEYGDKFLNRFVKNILDYLGCDSIFELLLQQVVAEHIKRKLSEETLNQIPILYQKDKEEVEKDIDDSLCILHAFIELSSSEDLASLSSFRKRTLLLHFLAPLLIRITRSLSPKYQFTGLYLTKKLVHHVIGAVEIESVSCYQEFFSFLGTMLIKCCGFLEELNLILCMRILCDICKWLPNGNVIVERFLQEDIEMGHLKTNSFDLMSFGLSLSRIIIMLHHRSSIYWKHMQCLIFSLILTKGEGNKTEFSPRTAGLFGVFVFITVNEDIEIIQIIQDDVIAILVRYELLEAAPILKKLPGKALAVSLHNAILSKFNEIDIQNYRKKFKAVAIT